jgi:hypothetical protein
MAIVLRSVKGSNLTAAEVDGNFTDLDTRVDTLETDPPVANGIANIVVTGSTFVVVLDDATELGPYDIPVATPRPTITTAAAATTLTPTLAQASAYFRCSNGSGCTVTIEDNATVAFPVDTELHFCQRGGTVSFVEGGTDVVINVPEGYAASTGGSGAVVTLKKVATDEWDLFGLLEVDVTA